MPRPRLNPTPIARLRRAGKTWREIATELGCSVAGAQRSVSRAGVAIPRRAHRVRTPEDLRLDNLWFSIRARCERPSDRLYAQFGALGIKLCREWQTLDGFKAWAAASGYRLGQALVLRNRRLGYRPSNCTWAARRDAVAHWLAHGKADLSVAAFGQTKTIAEWSRDPRCRVPRDLLRQRILKGWAPEKALTTESSRPQTLETNVVDWASAQRLYETGRSVREVAEHFGVSYGAIHKGLGRRNALRGDRPAVQERPHHRQLYAIWMRARRQARRHAQGRMRCEWPDFAAFYDWSMQSGFEPGLPLRLLDPARGMTASNCRWMSHREISALIDHPGGPGMPRRLIKAFGERKGLIAWTRDKRCNVSATSLIQRLRKGMPPELALTKPPRASGPGPRRLLTAFGMTQSITEWSRDPRCQVTLVTLSERLRKGVPLELAIKRDGVRRAVVDRR